MGVWLLNAHPENAATSSFADPHHFYADPDPAFHLDADPDPAFFTLMRIGS